MRKLGLWLMTILVVCLSFISVACSSKNKAKDEVKLNETAITLEIGDSYTLTATTNVKKGVTWSTSDESIATVDGGVVNALSAGSATITATAGKATATCTVTVNEAKEYAELTVDKTVVELKEGGASVSVTATFTVNDEARDCQFVWTSENDAIATVEDGKILPVSAGSTIVTVSVEYKGETYAVDVNVEVKPDEQIQVSKRTIELTLADINGGIVSDTFTAIAYKAGVENTEAALEYESSNEEVASVTVENGVATVTSVGEGTCTISVFYQSSQGKIETNVSVTVTRSTLVLDEIIETYYVEGNTSINVAALELQGAFEGVYFEGEKVSLDDDALVDTFVEANKGYVVNVELRTDIAIYSAQLHIFINIVVQGDARTEMPIYSGSATDLGFTEDTKIVYELVTTEATGWETRMVTNVETKKEYVKFDFVSTNKIDSVIMWPEKDSSTLGSYFISGEGAFTNDADPDRQIYVVDQDGYRATKFKAGVVYTVYFYLNEGETMVHFGSFNGTTIYIANIACGNGEIIPIEPENPEPDDPDDSSSEEPDVPVEVPDFVMQGDSREPVAAYTGDVTELGFAAGTTVYVIENKQAGLWDDCWNTRLSIPLKGAQKSVAIEFIATKEFGFDEIISVWGVAGIPHIGTINKTGIAGEWAVITDAEGNVVKQVKANTLYVLNIACENLTQIQVGFLGANLIYVGNFTCKAEDIPVVKVPTVMQGDARLPMPEYNGDAASLGFPEGTEVAYELVIDGANGADGWTNRMVAKVEAGKEVAVFDVIVKNIADPTFRFTMWPEIDGATLGSYGVSAKSNDPSVDADAYRKIFVLGTDNRQPSSFAVETLYTIYFFLGEGETHVHFSTFTNGLVYIANIRYIDADEVEYDPTLPPPSVSQGEDRNKMPTFDGDVTTLGFEAGTTVYQIIGPQGNANDVKLVAQVDASGDNAYAKLDFVLSNATSSLGLWITAENSHLGYYTVTPTGFTTDGHGDTAREIFVTNANGEKIQSFEANTKYTLYVGLDGREVTVQFTTWASLTIYVANVGCITEAEAPVEPVPPVADGKEISILFIGNSFSDDTEAYMIDILLELGYTKIDVGNLYIGGCDINTHYANILSNANQYDFRMRSHNGSKYTEYETTSVGGKKQSLGFAIAYKDWDVISVQQASGYSGKPDSYVNLDALVAEVKNRATNPEVEFVFNMTWAYQADSTHAQFPDYNSDQTTMYNAIVSAVQEKVTYTVVPNGTAIQNARTSFLGDNLTRDGYHLNLQIGRFIAGLTFVAKVTGEDISNFGYAPNGVTEEQLAIAIESVQNALNTPFAVTQSQFEEEVEDPDVPEGPITQGGSTLPTYTGDVTALGFAEGTMVYKYVGVDTSVDKAAIKVDSANYDYVDVQFVIAEGDGYFFAYALKGGNFLNGGASYVIDPSNIRLVNGSAMDRKIQVFDANGEPATTLMSTNTLYTLRVFIKAGEADQVMIAKNGSTIYLANVTFGLEADLPVEGPIKQGGGALPTYTGDATAHGFAEGEFLQYMTTETLTGEWWDSASVDSNGKTREQLAAKIIGEAGKYVTVKFATSEDIASGSVFYVWGLLGEQHTLNGGVNFTSTTHGRILTVDGYPVTSIAKNTVYVLELFIEGTDTYKVANICSTGMEIYFAEDSITYSDASMEDTLPDPEDPDSEPETEGPTPQAPIVSGETTSTALSVYDGDVTALGFAAGTTVYQLVSASLWNDRVKIAVDPAYKYLDVQFTVTSGNWYFNVWLCNASGMLDGSYLVAELGGGTQHATFGNGFAMHNPNSGANGGNTRIQVLDANGDVIIGNRPNGTVYTLRVWLEEEAVTEVQIGQDNVTMYFGNIESTNTEYETPDVPDVPELPEGPTAVEIKIGDNKADPTVFAGEETMYGFADGTKVVQMALEAKTDVDDKRLALVVDSSKQYLAIDFALEFALFGNIYVWTVTDGGERVLAATILAEGGVETGNLVNIAIKDSKGNDVTSQALIGLDSGAAEKYTLYVYYNGANEVHIGCDDYDDEVGGNILYFASAECRNDA